MTEILFTCPAFIVVDGSEHEFKVGDEFGIAYESRNNGTLYNFFKLGSVAAFAKEYENDPVEAEKRALERGHELYYAFGLGVVLHNGPKIRETKFGLKYGQIISFEGKKFRLDPTSNRNVKLVEVCE